MVLAEIIQKVDVFKGVSSDQIERIAAISQQRSCTEGEIIHGESSAAKALYVLVSGEVELQVQLSSNNRRVTVGVINIPYQCFGWSGLISPNYYTAAAICRNKTEVVAIDGKKLLEILEQDPSAGFRVMKGIAEIISSRLRNCRSAFLKTI